MEITEHLNITMTDRKRNMLELAFNRLVLFLEHNRTDQSESESESDRDDDNDLTHRLSPMVLQDKLSLIRYIPDTYPDLKLRYWNLIDYYQPFYPNDDLFVHKS